MGDLATTEVLGLGVSYEPFQVRPLTPEFRPVGNARRFTTQTITLNTDTAVIFEESALPFAVSLDMWNPANPTRLTAPIDGLYMVGGYAGRTSGSTENLRVWISKNGANTVPQVKRSSTLQTGGDLVMNSCMTLIRLDEDDYIELYLRQLNTGPTTVFAGAGSPGNDIEAGPRIWANWMGA
jgi:hypothetical protein